MAESTPAGSASFTWDGTPSVPELLNDGASSYIYGPNGEPIEQIDNSGVASFFFLDRNGTTRALLTSSGKVGAKFQFSPYGALTSSIGTLTTPLLYAGSYTDAATGELYLVNRYYDPATGQFTSVDPDLGTTGEPYEYTGDDPTNLVDPSGLFGWNPLSDIREAYSDVQQGRQDVDSFLSTQVGTYVSFVIGHIPVVGAAVSIVSDIYDVTSSLGKFTLDGCFGASGLDARCSQDDQEGISASEHLIRDALLAIPSTATSVISDILSIASLFDPVELGSGTLPSSSARASSAANQSQC